MRTNQKLLWWSCLPFALAAVVALMIPKWKAEAREAQVESLRTVPLRSKIVRDLDDEEGRIDSTQVMWKEQSDLLVMDIGKVRIVFERFKTTLSKPRTYEFVRLAGSTQNRDGGLSSGLGYGNTFRYQPIGTGSRCEIGPNISFEIEAGILRMTGQEWDLLGTPTLIWVDADGHIPFSKPMGDPTQGDL